MNKVEIKTEVKLEEITDKGVLVIDKKWERFEIPGDTIVLSLGFKSRTETVKSLQGLAREVYVIGDCADPPQPETFNPRCIQRCRGNMTMIKFV